MFDAAMFDAAGVRGKLTSPGAALAVTVIGALMLIMFPSFTVQLRFAADTALAPAQRAAAAGRRQATAWGSTLSGLFASENELIEARDEIAELRFRNRHLEDLLAHARRSAASEQVFESSPTRSSPLLLADLIEARILGRQARAFLAKRQIIDVGRNQEVQPDALVVSATPLLDQGRAANVAAGDLVLAGRHIVGRIDQSGPSTSTVKRVTQPGYRDVVLLAAADQPPSATAPRGILEGVGEELCRIRHIATTAPVAAGDVVYAAGEDGILNEPLIYGTITRVELAEDNAHWEIWVQPRTGPELPQTVAVLRARLNPHRLARNRP